VRCKSASIAAASGYFGPSPSLVPNRKPSARRITGHSGDAANLSPTSVRAHSRQIASKK
jgi:hypothetical protein